MLECLDIIVGGQILDLKRFGPAKEGGKLSALADNSELDDYTYRVAGCLSFDKNVSCPFDYLAI